MDQSYSSNTIFSPLLGVSAYAQQATHYQETRGIRIMVKIFSFPRDVHLRYTMSLGMIKTASIPHPSLHTILIVDDQEETFISTQLLLEREGYQVLTAVGGKEALSVFESRQIHVHLIIVDYFMPRMNGEELVQAIRSQDEDVQILLQTGYAGEKPPREMMQTLDIQGYHNKIDGPERLLLWIDTALKTAMQLKKVREAEQREAESQAQLRRLSARLLSLQEEERERISRELHDHLGQLLTGISMDVDWVRSHCPTELTRVHQQLQGTAKLVQETLQATRALSATLRPEVLHRACRRVPRALAPLG